MVLFNQGVWEYLHEKFGGGPACTQLYECVTCKEELEALLNRQTSEFNSFVHLNQRFQADTHPSIVFAISMRWFRMWEGFVRGRQQEPPPPIDNSSICVNKNGQPSLKLGSDYAPISEEIWNYFFEIYGGGPELCLRYGYPPSMKKVEDNAPSAVDNHNQNYKGVGQNQDDVSFQKKHSQHSENYPRTGNEDSTSSKQELHYMSRNSHDDAISHKHHSPSSCFTPTVHSSGRQRTASASEVITNF